MVGVEHEDAVGHALDQRVPRHRHQVEQAPAKEPGGEHDAGEREGQRCGIGAAEDADATQIEGGPEPRRRHGHDARILERGEDDLGPWCQRGVLEQGEPRPLAGGQHQQRKRRGARLAAPPPHHGGDRDGQHDGEAPEDRSRRKRHMPPEPPPPPGE